MGYSITIFRLLLCFVILLAYLKASANSQLAPMTASDQVGNIVIGALAGGTITSDVSTPMLVTVLVAWGLMQIAVRAMKYRSPRVAAVIDGQRIQLVQNGRLLTKNFDKTKLSPEDFVMALHQHEVDTVDDVWNVWYEPSGDLTIDKKGDALLSVALISNGSLIASALETLGKSEEQVKQLLAEKGYQGLGYQNIFLAEWHNKDLYIYPYENGQK